MKTFLIIPLFVFGFLIQTAAQQWQLGANIPFRLPIKTEMPNMRNNYGWGLQLGYSPWSTTPVFIELKTDWNQYAVESYTDAYMYSDGYIENEYVAFRSKTNNWLLGSKIMLGQSYGTVRGFITPQIGLTAMKTKMEIEDNNHFFNSNDNTIYRKVFARNIGGIYGAEIGMEVALEKLFSSVSEKDFHRLYVSVSYLGSFSKMKYLNVRKMEEYLSNFPNFDYNINNPNFLQMTPNNLYTLQFAEVYRSHIQLIGFTLGYIASF